jgi:V/A-type H+-transporting ATPase subunit E
MSGIDEILDMISAQQKQTEESMIQAARSKADRMLSEGNEKAEAAYKDYMDKAGAQLERDYENGCNSVDAEMKRRILACKVGLIDEALEKAVKKLKSLPDKEYFEMLSSLAEKHLRSGEAVIQLSAGDLKRVPADFEKGLSAKAEKLGGSVKLSREPADISDGFVLSYGLISENCSFGAIIEAEREEVRDIAARELFGQVS